MIKGQLEEIMPPTRTQSFFLLHFLPRMQILEAVVEALLGNHLWFVSLDHLANAGFEHCLSRLQQYPSYPVFKGNIPVAGEHPPPNRHSPS